MTPRAYAASLGLAEMGKRGRMSAAANEAIETARKGGMEFADATPVKTTAPKVIKVTAPKPATVKAGQFDAKAVRAWAATVGLTTNTRGRLSAEVLAAYAAANPAIKASEPGTIKAVAGKDIRPTAPETRDSDVRYFAWVNNKRVSVSSRTACKCGYSLSHCGCGSPMVSLGTSIGGRMVDVSMSRGV
jgi:hypothetical protein